MGGGGGGGRNQLKCLGAIYTKQGNSRHVCKNMGGVGNSYPINETMLVCRVIGNVHTVASVYWYAVGGENMSWVCMLMGGHIVVYAGSVHSHWGDKNVIWCVGRVILNS